MLYSIYHISYIIYNILYIMHYILYIIYIYICYTLYAIYIYIYHVSTINIYNPSARPQIAFLGSPGGALGELWEARATTGGPEASWRKKLSKHMCFTIKSEATDHFACTRRERPSPNTVKTDRLAPAWSTRGARRHFTAS